MSFLHPHRVFPEEFLDSDTAVWWRDNAAMFFRVLTQEKYRRFYLDGNLSNNLLIYPPGFVQMESKMNGRKPKRPSVGSGSVDDKSVAFKWVNIPLTDQDLDILEQETADLEQLALAFISLGMQRLGLSVKYDRVRESYSVSIYGRDMGNAEKPCGVSGTAADLRDALCVSLYRFNTCLQGSFDGSTVEGTTFQPKRFR